MSPSVDRRALIQLFLLLAGSVFCAVFAKILAQNYYFLAVLSFAFCGDPGLMPKQTPLNISPVTKAWTATMKSCRRRLAF